MNLANPRSALSGTLAETRGDGASRSHTQPSSRPPASASKQRYAELQGIHRAESAVHCTIACRFYLDSVLCECLPLACAVQSIAWLCTESRVFGLQDDAADAEWLSVTELPQPLAFDHKEVVRTAFSKLKEQPHVASNGEACCRAC